MDARAATSLLNEFKKVSGQIERPQTFMEIAGYPHYENVCSNFLAFFFDPEHPHGLGNLFLDALLDSVDRGGEEVSLGGNISVEREVVTSEGNRIDLLIKSDSHAVLIENKIYAAAHNPFDDYAAYLDSLKNENRFAYENKIKVLLTLYPTGEGAEWGFVNLTHADFSDAIRTALGHHVSEADTRYLTLMLDFLNTLEHFEEGTRMNQEFIQLLGKRSSELEELLWSLKEVRDELRGKVQELAALIEVSAYRNVEQSPWRPNIPLEHYLQHRIHVDEEAYIVVDTLVSPAGWEFWIYPRKGVKHSMLENLLHELNIPFEVDEGYIYYPAHFDYDEDLNRIARDVQDIVDKISRKVG